jgi:two-component system LytT family response regulator
MNTAIIIEDEPQYARMLQSLVNEFYPDIVLKGMTGSVKEAERMIESIRPDIIFSDIELSDGSVFDLLKRLSSINAHIIFITAHNEFAIEAFRFSAVDYLLKPLKENEFRIAVEKALERVELKQMQHIRLMLENMDKTNENKRLVLRTLEQIHIINIRDIIRCQSDNTYTTFYLVNTENILVSKGLREYEDLLCSNGFFKVHQSHIINLQFLRKIDKTTDEVILSDKSRIPLSFRRKQPLLQILNQS